MVYLQAMAFVGARLRYMQVHLSAKGSYPETKGGVTRRLKVLTPHIVTMPSKASCDYRNLQFMIR
jgi:hypothetical protein